MVIINHTQVNIVFIAKSCISSDVGSFTKTHRFRKTKMKNEIFVILLSPSPATFRTFQGLVDLYIQHNPITRILLD